jgi:hypothetical protein
MYTAYLHMKMETRIGTPVPIVVSVGIYSDPEPTVYGPNTFWVRDVISYKHETSYGDAVVGLRNMIMKSAYYKWARIWVDESENASQFRLKRNGGEWAFEKWIRQNEG